MINLSGNIFVNDIIINAKEHIQTQNKDVNYINTDITTRSVSTNLLLVNNDNSHSFNEVVRRIKQPLAEDIYQKLLLVSTEELLQLDEICNNPELILTTKKAFFTKHTFSYIALQALRLKRISVFMFGTLQSLSFQLQEIPSILSDNKIKLYSLFEEDKSPNHEAWNIIEQTIEKSNHKNSFIELNAKKVIKQMQTNMSNTNSLEACFWLLDILTEITLDLSNIYYRLQVIGLKALSIANNKQMFPSMTLYQEFLKAAFPINYSLINPVLGNSSIADIRDCGYKNSRDFMLPFDQLPLPKKADGFASKTIIEFQYHEFYHATRLSMMPHQDIIFYLNIGYELEKLKQRFKKTIIPLKDLIKKQLKSINIVDIKSKEMEMYLTSIEKNEIENEIYLSIKILFKLKNMIKAIGQFQFLMYDLDFFQYNKGSYDIRAIDGEKIFLLSNIQNTFNKKNFDTPVLKGTYAKLAGKVIFNYVKNQINMKNEILNSKNILSDSIATAKNYKIRNRYRALITFLQGGLDAYNGTTNDTKS